MANVSITIYQTGCGKFSKISGIIDTPPDELARDLTKSLGETNLITITTKSDCLIVRPSEVAMILVTSDNSFGKDVPETEDESDKPEKNVYTEDLVIEYDT